MIEGYAKHVFNNASTKSMPVDVIVEQINSTFSCKNHALFCYKFCTSVGCAAS